MMRQYIWWLMVVLFTIPAFVTLLRPGIHNIQDNMQYFRIYEMGKCLEDGQIPCRWVPDMGYGFGYPLFLYYSPSPYYLGSFVHALGFQYIDSVKILFIGGFLLSALGMYALLVTIFNAPKLAFFGSLLYVYVPVRAVQVYVRGSLGEFLSMAIFPLLFLVSYRIVKNIGRNNILWLGLAVFGLLTTHNLMSIAFAPILIVWITYLIIINNKRVNLLNLSGGVLLGVGLASFFVVPLIFERSYVHLESMTGGYFDYRQHFVNLYQLFVSNHWGYGSSQLGAVDDMSLSVGQIQWVLALIALILAIINFKKRKIEALAIIIFSALSLVVIFLVHQRSSFVWDNLGFMAMFQFPWRFLVISAFLLTLTSVYGLYLIKDKYQKMMIIVITILLFVLYGGFFRPQKWFNINDKELLRDKEFIKQQTASIFDYLPVSATLPPNYQALAIPEVTYGSAFVNTYSKGSDYQTGNLTVIGSEAKIRLPIFDFPGMILTDNGRSISFGHTDCSGQDHCFGQISFTLTEGNHDISVRLGKTIPRKVGDLISLASLFVVAIIVFKKKHLE
jgi:hypothetical protein